MSHDRDHDRPLAVPPPRETPPLVSRKQPDRKRPEHPSAIPDEPVDPQPHPR